MFGAATPVIKTVAFVVDSDGDFLANQDTQPVFDSCCYAVTLC